MTLFINQSHRTMYHR